MDVMNVEQVITLTLGKDNESLKSLNKSISTIYDSLPKPMQGLIKNYINQKKDEFLNNFPYKIQILGWINTAKEFVQESRNVLVSAGQNYDKISSGARKGIDTADKAANILDSFGIDTSLFKDALSFGRSTLNQSNSAKAKTSSLLGRVNSVTKKLNLGAVSYTL